MVQVIAIELYSIIIGMSFHPVPCPLIGQKLINF